MVSLMLPFPLPFTSAKGLMRLIPSFTHLSSCPVISIHTLLNLGQARKKKLSTLLCQTVNALGWGSASLPHLGLWDSCATLDRWQALSDIWVVNSDAEYHSWGMNSPGRALLLLGRAPRLQKREKTGEVGQAACRTRASLCLCFYQLA